MRENTCRYSANQKIVGSRPLSLNKKIHRMSYFTNNVHQKVGGYREEFIVEVVISTGVVMP